MKARRVGARCCALHGLKPVAPLEKFVAPLMESVARLKRPWYPWKARCICGETALESRA